jgi:predicted dinucleotide-binding enzyme
MKIGIIGAGHIGATLARHFAKAGHQVGISNSRGPNSLAGLVKSMGPNTCAMTGHEAAWFGEVVLLAAPWRKTEALPLPKLVAGKIVVDAMNPYSAEGEVMDLGPSTSSEEVARRLPGARLVKAFNTLYYHTLATETRASDKNRLVIFVAGDDAEAKTTVSRLIDQIGFAALDTGSLREGGRLQEPGSPIYNRPLTLDQARDALRALELTAVPNIIHYNP